MVDDTGGYLRMIVKQSVIEIRHYSLLLYIILNLEFFLNAVNNDNFVDYNDPGFPASTQNLLFVKDCETCFEIFITWLMVAY